MESFFLLALLLSLHILFSLSQKWARQKFQQINSGSLFYFIICKIKKIYIYIVFVHSETKYHLYFFFFFPLCYVTLLPSIFTTASTFLYFHLYHFPILASQYLIHLFFLPSRPQTHQCFWVQTCISISQCYLYVNSSSQIFTIGPSWETDNHGWNDSPFVNKNPPKETLKYSEKHGQK